MFDFIILIRVNKLTANFVNKLHFLNERQVLLVIDGSRYSRGVRELVFIGVFSNSIITLTL